MNAIKKNLCVIAALFFGLVVYSDTSKGAVKSDVDVLKAYQLKHSLTATQKKIDSQLLLFEQRGRDLPTAVDFYSVNGVGSNACEISVIECKVKCKVSDRIINLVEKLGGEVVSKSVRFEALHVKIPVANLEKLAADGDVMRIERLSPRQTNKSTMSEGTVAHRAKAAWKDFGVTGRGIKVGVISDSARYWTTMRDSGDLPSNITIMPGSDSSGQTGEGSGMMEIVYDMAPDAQLYFADSGGMQEKMADNILALRQAGCRVIVDDISYWTEPVFQDGPIAIAVNSVVDDGCVYLSSAGNNRVSIENGTKVISSIWEGDFVAATPSQINEVGFLAKYGISPNADGSLDINGCSYYVHCFNNSSVLNRMAFDYGAVDDYVGVVLGWADKWEASENDYDLMWYDANSGDVIYLASSVQDGNGNPQEWFNLKAQGYVELCDRYDSLSFVVLKKKGSSNRFFRLDTNGGALVYSSQRGTTYGHNAAEKAICVAAAPVVVNRAFTAADLLEDFSSEGPRRIFFYPNGTAISAGNFSSTGGRLLQKPDVTGADRTASSWPGHSSGFGGTSAAAPHIAGIVALMLERNSKLTPDQVKETLYESTVNGSDWDYRAGYGIVDAYLAVKNATESAPSAPDNDNVANAIPISGQKNSTSGTNVSATKDEGNIGGLASVWWKWTAPITADVTFSTLFSDFDTDLKIYVGSSVSTLKFVTENNDYLQSDTYSCVTFRATAGATYYVSVSGVQGATGRIALSWEQIPDAKADLAISVPAGGTSWSKAFFLANEKYSLTATNSFEIGEKIFRNFAIANIGNKDAGQFTIKHVISGSANRVWTESHDGVPASSGSKTYLYRSGETDYNLNSLSQGNYTYMIYLDSDSSVQESNENNNSATVTFSIVQSTVEPLQPPTDFDATEQTKSKYIQLSWEAGSDPHGDRVGYNVYRSTTSTKPDQPWRMVNTFTKTTDATCDAGICYYYWVTSRSKNGSEGDVTGPISIVPTVDGAGRNVRVSSSVTSSSVHFGFEGIDSCMLISVYRSTKPYLPVYTYKTLSASATWDDTEIESSATYYYWIEINFGLYTVSKMFTVEIPESLPDLCFASLPGWTRSVFLGSSSDNPAELSSYEAGQPIYLYNCWMNNGTTATGRTFVQRHEVLDEDGNVVRSTNVVMSAANAGAWGAVEGEPFELLQRLRPGRYTYRCILDSQYEVTESNESNNRMTFGFEVLNQECDIRFVTHTGWLEYEFVWLSHNDFWDDEVYAPVRCFAQGESPYVNFTIYNSLGGYALCPSMKWDIYDSGWNIIKTVKVDMNSSLLPEWNCVRDEIGWSWQSVFQNMSPGTYCLAITLDPDQIINDTNRGNDVRLVQFVITNTTAVGIAESLESDLSFTAYGPTPPFAQTEFSCDGSDAVQFGPCRPGETNGLSAVVTGPGKLSFKWLSCCASTSSRSYDHHLVFWIDGESYVISGHMNSEWRTRELDVSAGQHVIRWEYCKDKYDDKYLDSAWIDQVSWTPYVKPDQPVLSALTTSDIGVSLVIQQSKNAIGYDVYRASDNSIPSTAYAQFLGNGMDRQTYMDSNVEKGATYHYWIVAVGAGDMRSEPMYCGSVTILKREGDNPDSYGPLGTRDEIDDSDESGAPTTLRRIAVYVHGQPATVNDCIAVYRADTGKLCGLGRVDWYGRVTIVLTIRQNVGLHFKLWVAASGLDTPEILDCDASSDLISPSQGTMLEDVVVNFSGLQDLQLSFAKAGWHKMSVNVLPDDASPAFIFGEVAGSLELLSGSKGRYWDFEYDEGPLAKIAIGDGYWLKTKVDNVQWTVSGMSDPGATIQLQQGWNLVGYPLMEERSINTVLATAVASGAIDMIVGDKGAFWPDGDLRKMAPGQGYYIYALNDYELGYDVNPTSGTQSQTSGRGMAMTLLSTNGEDEDAYGPFGTRDQIDDSDQSGSPTTLRQMQVTINGEQAAEGDCVAVYRADHNTICGLGRVNANGRVTIVMTINQGVGLHFKAWVASSGTTTPVILDCDSQSDMISPSQGDVVNGLTLEFPNVIPPATCTVSFNKNGGSGTMDSQTVDKGVATKLNKCTFTKTGYSFKEWSGSDGNIYGDQQSVTLSADLALTAQWTGNVYRVTFDRQNGSGGSSYVDATYDAAMPAITLPMRTDHDFGGYFTGTDGSGTKYYNADGTSAHAWDTTSGTTLYAYWTYNGGEYYQYFDGVVRWDYRVVAGTAIIQNPDGDAAIGPVSPTGEVVLPSTLGGCPVVKIGDSAFSLCSGLVGVVMPNSMTNIGNYAFCFCDSLTSITIPDGVTGIGDGAFKGCANLESIVFTGNAPVLGNKVFEDVNASCVVKVSRTSTGWGVTIPGVWNGLPIEFLDPDPLTFTVSFSKNSGTGTMPDQKFTEDVEQAIAKNAFKKSGYMFVGWKDQYDNEYEDEAVITPTSDLTLAAQWEKIVVACDPTGAEHPWRGDGLLSGSFGVTCNTDWTASSNKSWIKLSNGTEGSGDGMIEYSLDENDGAARDGTITVTSKIDGTVKATFTVNQKARPSEPDLDIQNGALVGVDMNGYDKLDVPSGVTAIGANAFACNDEVCSVRIPATVTEIGDSAFAGCVNLTNVVFDGNAPTTGNDVFKDTPDGLVVTVRNDKTDWPPEGSKWPEGDANARTVAVIKNYIVSFDWNGWEDGPAIEDIVVEPGDEIELPYRDLWSIEVDNVVTKRKEGVCPGLYFDGWSENGLVTESRADFLHYIPSGSVTLKARWNANVYQFEFNANGGKPTGTKKFQRYGEQWGDVEDPTLANAVFDGWWTAKTGGDPVDLNGVCSTVGKLGGTMTLYAHWRKMFKATVKDGMVSEDAENYAANVTVLNGTELYLEAADKSDKNMEFAKWTCSPATANLGESFNPRDPNTTFTMPDAAVTFTANYIAKPGYVTVFAYEVNSTLNEDDDPQGIEWSDDGKVWTPVGDDNAYPVKTGKSVAIQFRSTDPRWTVPAKVNYPIIEDETTEIEVAATRVSVVEVEAESEQFAASGTVTVSPKNGQVLPGKPVTLTAKPGKDTVFAYWTVDGEKVGYTATFKYAPDVDCTATAVFRLKSAVEDPVLDADAVVPSANAMVGVAFESQVPLADAAYPAKFSAKGLPTGLKIDAASGVISGIPTKAGDYVVTVTALSGANAKLKSTIALPISIKALPDWAQGTFTGYVQRPSAYIHNDNDYGLATFTVSAAGKVRGKVSLEGTNYTFSAASFDASSETKEYFGATGDIFVTGTFFIKSEMKSGKVSKPISLILWQTESLTVGGTELVNATAIIEFEGRETFGYLFRTMWKDKETAAAAKTVLAGWEGVYTVSFGASGGEGAPGGEYGSGYLSLVVGKDGNVKATGKLADGTSVSATSPLMYDLDWGWFAYFYAAPSAYKGGALAVEVRFDGGQETRRILYGSVAQWRSKNAEATGEYGEGFDRTLGFTGAYYDKLEKLNAYYESLRLSLSDVPTLSYTYKSTYVDDDTGRKVTESWLLEEDAVDTLGQEGMTVAVDDKGTIVVAKATKPTQDNVTKEWRYDGANDGGLTLSFTQATGIFKGSYTFWYDYMSAYDATTDKSTWSHTSKKVNFEGIMVQGEGLKGFYLWDAIGIYKDETTGYKYKQSFPVWFSGE